MDFQRRNRLGRHSVGANRPITAVPLGRVLPNRDRKGVGAFKNLPNEKAIGSPCSSTTYRIASPHILILPQPLRAPRVRPAPSIWSISTKFIQPPASIRFEIIHYLLRLNLGLNNHMNMISSDVRCEQVPTAMRADFLESFQHHCAGAFIEQIRLLNHRLALHSGAFCIRVQRRASQQAMSAIDGAW